MEFVVVLSLTDKTPHVNLARAETRLQLAVRRGPKSHLNPSTLKSVALLTGAHVHDFNRQSGLFLKFGCSQFSHIQH